MATRTSSEQTRSALIQEGIDQFSVVGYHGTGIKQILDVMQVPKGSFYNYFPSKEAFGAEVVKAFGQQMLEDLDESINKNQLSVIDTLQAILDDSVRHCETLGCRQGCLVGSLAAELGNQNILVQQAMQEVVDQWELRIADLLDRGQQVGEVRNDVPAEQLAKIFWSCWQGALMRMKLEGGTDSAREIAYVLVNSVLKR